MRTYTSYNDNDEGTLRLTIDVTPDELDNLLHRLGVKVCDENREMVGEQFCKQASDAFVASVSAMEHSMAAEAMDCVSGLADAGKLRQDDLDADLEYLQEGGYVYYPEQGLLLNNTGTLDGETVRLGVIRIDPAMLNWLADGRIEEISRSVKPSWVIFGGSEIVECPDTVAEFSTVASDELFEDGDPGVRIRFDSTEALSRGLAKWNENIEEPTLAQINAYEQFASDRELLFTLLQNDPDSPEIEMLYDMSSQRLLVLETDGEKATWNAYAVGLEELKDVVGDIDLDGEADLEKFGEPEPCVNFAAMAGAEPIYFPSLLEMDEEDRRAWAQDLIGQLERAQALAERARRGETLYDVGNKLLVSAKCGEVRDLFSPIETNEYMFYEIDLPEVGKLCSNNIDGDMVVGHLANDPNRPAHDALLDACDGAYYSTPGPALRRALGNVERAAADGPDTDRMLMLAAWRMSRSTDDVLTLIEPTTRQLLVGAATLEREVRAQHEPQRTNEIEDVQREEAL